MSRFLPWLGGMVIIAAFLIVIFLNHNGQEDQISERPETAPSTNDTLNGTSTQGESIQTVVNNLFVPWSIVFLPGGDMLVTERNGTLRRIGTDPAAIKINTTNAQGEGGLLGLALHPNFATNNWIYLYESYKEGNSIKNRVTRYDFRNNSLENRRVIIDTIPGSSNHDGGRIAFGPDDLLYITTGDAGNENGAQDTNSLAGKILRLHDDGRIPAANPFQNAVYSYGHRNPQGLAWDDRGRLWSTEHGRSGIQSGYDELNVIEVGANYGWPVIEGDETGAGMKTPILHSGPTTTWAPASLAFHDGKLYFGGLRGEALYEVPLEGQSIGNLVSHFKGDYGRIRTVVFGPDGSLYFSTSNRDGRGQATAADDRIIKTSL